MHAFECIREYVNTFTKMFMQVEVAMRALAVCGREYERAEARAPVMDLLL